VLDYSLIDKIKILFSSIGSSYFFIGAAIIGLILIILSVIDIVRHKKINKIVYICTWVFVIAFIVIRYWSFLSSLGDNLINNIFMAIYFPNLAVYTSLLVISNSFFIYSIMKKSLPKIHKLFNIFNAVIFDFLFLLIIDEISKNDIDIYSSLDVYTDSSLLVLIELSTALILIWIIVSIFTHYFLIFNSRSKHPAMIVDNPTTLQIDDTSSKISTKASVLSPVAKECFERIIFNDSSLSNDKQMTWKVRKNVVKSTLTNDAFITWKVVEKN
jgi:uncharacterized membrane protein